MTPTEFRSLRRKLRRTQEQLAAVMGYGSQSRISEVEGGETVPAKAERLILAYISGYRPSDWPD